MEWLRRWTDEKFGKEYSRRQLLKKIPHATAMLLGSTFLSRELFSRYMADAASPKEKEPRKTQEVFQRPAHLETLDVVAENRKPGSERWKITNPAGNRLQGYASAESVVPGESITFYVHSETPFQMEIYRMGWYGGKGGRHMTTLNGFQASPQNLEPDPETYAADWTPTLEFRVPSDWPTGCYLVKLVDQDGREAYIFFVVRQQVPAGDLAVLLSTNTYQAYNNWGGKSLYGYNSTRGVQAHQVSLNRPYRSYYGSGLFFQFEYNLIRWLEMEGYSVTYLTDMDLHHRLLETSYVYALIIAGHSEYWSMDMRKSVEHLTASRMNLAVFSANCAYWQIRLEPDKYGRADRVMVSYKQFAVEKDPLAKIDPLKTTGLFRQAPVNMPEDRMFGIMYSGIPDAPAPLVITRADHWLFEGTGLKNGDRIPGVVGGEVDSYGGQLPGVEVLAASPVMLYGKKKDAHVIWWKKPTGGKVFAVGTFYWNWFLDPIHHTQQAKENETIRRITSNALLALIDRAL
ncbi:N,N-dimethylformamidase beta subunit family domain-containing protein [Staphylospora marina]|uniref:N,N-dimethylformamidase beta subunit family domain-containing protein n=1 Tax=Staphylospora marina TaxID=2490858 RepID=UPI0030B9966E